MTRQHTTNTPNRHADPRNRALRPALYALLIAALAMLLGPFVGPDALAQDNPDQADKPKPEQTLTDKLGGDDRYTTHLATDKPIYRGGETVYVRGTILHAFTHKPIEDGQREIILLDEQINLIQAKQDINDEDRREIRDLSQRRWQIQQQNRLNPMVEIKDPKGAIVTSGRTNVQDSVIGFKWDVPENQAGGEYTVKVSYPWSGLAPAERTFDIRAYRPPRIKTQIDFLKDGYGPGDTVVATIEATRAEGGIPEGAKVIAIARVDGQEVARLQTMVRETGVAEARFDLPDTIERGEGSLTFVIEDGGVIESASKTLPILLQSVDVNIYPSGGYLAGGYPNQVYFEARTPYGKPADVKGVIVDETGKEVAQFETKHEGRGVFSLNPHPDRKYKMMVREPASVTESIELPAVGGPTLVTSFEQTKGVFEFDEPITLQTRVKTGGTVVFELRHREQVVGTDKISIHPGLHPPYGNGLINFDDLPDSATGILTVTAYDTHGNPLIERLIYRAPKNHVNIEIVPDSAQYTPGGKVALTIKTTDQDGKPVSAVAGVTVTDDSVLEMIETREQAPNLPAMVFLENEVDELADAHVYLDPNNKDAAEQLDLLLGTQGWRRFALVNLEDFLAEHGDDARRLLALRVPVWAELEKVRRRMVMPEAVLLADAVPGAAAFEAEGLADDAAVAPPPAPEPVPAVPQPGLDPKPALDQPAAEEQNDFQKALEQGQRREAEQLLLAEADLDLAARRRIAMPTMVFIREYAHKQPAGKPFGQRSDFTETVYWSSATKTDEKGLATVEFDLSDSVTSFRIKTDAFTKDGALGAGSELIESVRPFYIEPKLPLELTAGDKVLLPIAMVNNTDRELPVGLTVSKLGQAGKTTIDAIPLGADTRGRTIYELAIGEKYGDLGFTIMARAGQLSDTNKRSLRVVPKGFPINDGSGGMLKPDGEIESELTIPDTVVPGSLTASVSVYPTPLANLTEALEALIREPSGCFEQTSSTTFPLVMAQQYFLSHQGVDPDLIARSKEKLDKGYQRLIGFETDDKGYEWFGSTPPHEALTAYGLLQFNEMKDVMDVDQKMIDRTADWLLSRVDEDGSFKLDKKALDSFGRAPQDTTNAYIVWSMLEAGYDPAKIEQSIGLVLKTAAEGDDAYTIALAANIAQLAKRDEAAGLLNRLAGKLDDEGFVDGAVTSITRSGGDALKIETTSLAILAWLRDDEYTGQVEKAILWLTERCKAGRFGSTQSTVLALKAIVEYDKARSTPKAPGTLTLLVDGKPVGEPIAFNEETKGAIHLPSLASHLTPGKHIVAVQMAGGSKMPYAIKVDYFAETPASSDACKLRIETSFANPAKESFEAGWKEIPGQANIAEGETTEVNVKVTNRTIDGLPTPLAIVGLPGGLEPDFDQLKELVAAKKIAAFEVIGRDVVLYWREIKPEQVIDLSIRCTAAIPGTYTGPASRVYEYYTDEHKHWVDGLAVTITPRQN